MPPDANPAEFILSDGKRNDKPKPSAIRTLREFFRSYGEQLPRGTKEESTLYGEQIHIRHLLRHLKGTMVVRSITTRNLQDYIAARLRETWNGKPIRPATIKKELTTFRLIWNWAVDQGYLSDPAPTKGLKFPKSDEKPPFMTWGEIEAKLARGGLSRHQEEELWSCLFLKPAQAEDVLEHAKLSARLAFAFPMFVFVCHTGARRSEMLRSQIDDFDFRTRTVQIREKKKSRSKAMTFRHIPMTDLLHDTMSEWFQNHPGGQFTICQGLTTVRGKKRDTLGPLTPSEARDHFKRTLAECPWEKIKGFHVFRHSFASNLAAAGVDQRIIDEWMGHQTEEMRKRYRHLFPDQQREAIELVFGRNRK